MKGIYRFGTAINCIDGRVQDPVSDWVKLHGKVQQVDMITEPGADGVLSSGNQDGVLRIFKRAEVSYKAHDPLIIAIAGHFDCVANPGDFQYHKEQIEESVKLIHSWRFGIRIVGLYVNEWKTVDLVCDSESEFKEMKSFL